MSVGALVLHSREDRRLGPILEAVPFGVIGVGFLMLVIEVFAGASLRGALFGVGPVVAKRRIRADRRADVAPGETCRLDRSTLRFVAPDVALFGPRSTPLVRGALTWSGSRARLVVHASLGLRLFVLGWVLGGLNIAIGSWAFFGSDPSAVGTIFAVLPLLLLTAGVIAFFRVVPRLEKQVAAQALDEIVAWLERDDDAT